MKNLKYSAVLIVAGLLTFAACRSKKPVVPEIFDEFIELRTDSGTMRLVLYDETPLHKANFLKLVNEKFYDSLLFHRVISGFMIQGGDPGSKTAGPQLMLGAGDIGYTIPAEFNPKRYHKKGALAAARTNNPEKASSGCQFYIVQGSGPIDTNMLSDFSQRTKFDYDSLQKKTYATVGGTPFLDGSYTVFGEVVSGMEVIDKIAKVPTGQANRPIGNVRMYMRVIKVPRAAKK